MAADPEKLFEVDPDWVSEWTDLPEYVMEDHTAQGGEMKIFFRTYEDRVDFFKKIEVPNPDRAQGVWYPYAPRPRDGVEAEFEPEKVGKNRYPIYIISKGRWEDSGGRLTYPGLEALGIPYRIVIEPQEYDRYVEHVDPEKIITLPFSNLGQGSIPARNFCWDHSQREGWDRHWILDDNMPHYARINRNRNKIIKDENPFTACEDFVDRYENVALSGLNYRWFADARHPDLPPYRLNTRVYSCILIKNDIPYRWRGRYNEDTDLSLRVLKDGWVTVLLNAYCVLKTMTMEMGGGNTDELYAGDGRLKMAESLQKQHPDCVVVSHKWGHAQHHVDYGPFKHNKLIKK